MRVLVDTSVWSRAFRKADLSEADKKVVARLTKAIRDLELEIIGPVRQEILSGIKDKDRFEELKSKLAVFKDLAIETPEYELAAEYYNTCRSHGIQGSHIDYLICAVAVQNKLKVFTLDTDFDRYRNYIPVELETV